MNVICVLANNSTREKATSAVGKIVENSWSPYYGRLSMKDDYFEHKAQVYDLADDRVANVVRIAESIRHRINLQPSMDIMDFGSGTGLLLEQLATSVRSICAVDISPSMHKQLEEKRHRLACSLETVTLDLSTHPLNRSFDGIVSSMTMHHIDDVADMFSRFNSLLDVGGFIAIADLDREHGHFHSEDTGVFHHGFDRENIMDFARSAGFVDVEIQSASTVKKPQGDFSIFLLTAVKQKNL